jgi:hypothetical protein
MARGRKQRGDDVAVFWLLQPVGTAMGGRPLLFGEARHSGGVAPIRAGSHAPISSIVADRQH